MYVINDIELLQRLWKHKILEYLSKHCILALSDIRLNDYSFSIRQGIETNKEIRVLQVDNNFDKWFANKRQYLSVSDLSTVYVALINKSAILVLSSEDQILKTVALGSKVNYLNFDEFIIRVIKDEKVIDLYNLIKAA